MCNRFTFTKHRKFYFFRYSSILSLSSVFAYVLKTNYALRLVGIEFFFVGVVTYGKFKTTTIIKLQCSHGFLQA